MVNKVSGAFDILAAIIIFLSMYDIIGNVFLLAVVVYFIVRMIAFYGEPLYMVDGLIALIVFVNLLYHNMWVGYIIVIYLLVKGVYYLRK